jgi:hypothetical protein
MTEFYRSFEKDELVVRGPEFSQDLSYWIVHGSSELMELEQPVALSALRSYIEAYPDRPRIEFSLLQRFT